MQGAIYPSLKDRTVLVTGGGSGIGEAIVRRFVGQGSRVGFIDIDVKASKQLLESLPAHASVHFEHADLRDIGALRRAVAGVREAFGPITILVNNDPRRPSRDRGRHAGILGRADRHQPDTSVL